MSVEVVVDSRVRVPLAGDGAEVLRNLFRHRNPKYPGSGAPYEETWAEAGGETSVPRGGMGRVRAFLEAQGLAYRVSDRRHAGDFALLDDPWAGDIPGYGRELWDFQERVVGAAMERQNCIIQSATGTGKTSAAIALIARAGRPAIVIVNSKGLRDQWVGRVAAELGVEAGRVGQIGDGVRRTAPVTVAMQQTLARGIDPRWLGAFGVVVADEVDIFAAPTFFAAVDPWPAKYRVGVTATLERHDRRDYLVRDLFGEVVAEVTREEAVAKGRIVEVEVVVAPTGEVAPWYAAARASNNRYRLFAGHKRLLNQLYGSAPRNRLIYDLVELEVARGRRCLVLSQRVAHCRELHRTLRRMGIRTGLMLGGKAQEAEFALAKEGLASGDYHVVVATDKAAGRAQDLPALEVAVAAMRVGNNATLASQVVGRLCRACKAIGKTEGTLYALHDAAISGRGDVENLVRWFGRVSVLGPRGELQGAAEYLGGIRGPRAGSPAPSRSRPR